MILKVITELSSVYGNTFCREEEKIIPLPLLT